MGHCPPTDNSGIPDPNREDPVGSEILDDIVQLASNGEDDGMIVETVSNKPLFPPFPVLILSLARKSTIARSFSPSSPCCKPSYCRSYRTLHFHPP